VTAPKYPLVRYYRRYVIIMYVGVALLALAFAYMVVAFEFNLMDYFSIPVFALLVLPAMALMWLNIRYKYRLFRELNRPDADKKEERRAHSS